MKKMIPSKMMLYATTMSLAAGTIIGWWSVATEVSEYCDAAGGGIGSLFSSSVPHATNPLLTPCFYGSIAFAAALVWSVHILVSNDKPPVQAVRIRKLLWLLWFGTVFALINNAFTFYNFYLDEGAGGVLGCDPNKITNPFMTACFGGFIAFILAAICATGYYRQLGSKIKKTDSTET